MGANEFRYGIFMENELMTDLTNDQKPRTALLGQIVKIEGILGNENLQVCFLRDTQTWESKTFRCPRRCILPIFDKLWPYIAAIPSPQERVRLVKNRERCEKLTRLDIDMTVGFLDIKDLYLGQIKYMGNVKGMGKCIGIKLNEPKKDNKCNGSYAGIQYFTCLPGYGVFTTVDQIVPVNTTFPTTTTKETTELDNYLERNMTSFMRNTNGSCNGSDILPKYEEIVTKYGEYSKVATTKTPTTATIRSSLSLQNIIDIGNNSSNSNNDFDQNSVIPPDKTYLINKSDKKIKNKSELDLYDIIGNNWHGTTDRRELEEFSNLTKSLERNEHSAPTPNRTINGTLTRRNKSGNPLSHFYNGTISKKIRNEHRSDRDESVVTARKDEKKINEKSDVLTKAQTTPPLPPAATTTTTIKTQQNNDKKPKYHPPKSGTTNDLTIGTLVEVLNDVSKSPLYGVVRWIGVENGTNFILVGVELEEEQTHLPLTLTDGTHNGERMFRCAENRALFVPLQQCHKDSRFQDGLPTPVHQLNSNHTMECPVIQGAVAPLCMPTEEDVEAVCGKFRGIQGHHNSCYLDVTLFSMFTYTAVFDSLLFRPKGPNDIDDYEEVQRVLREEIVNPLRKNLFVSAANVMNLRKLLDRLSSVSGLTSEEKDPEEFLNSLLAQILKAEPFLKLNSGQEAFYYQLFVEKDADLTLPTVQQLFEQSFLTSNIKLKEVPSCLIIQMPRFGKNYKMYPRILPSQLLDVTDVIEGSPRQCIVCGKLARWECRECFDSCSTAGLESTSFCTVCLKTAHRHERRIHHKPVALEVSLDFAIMEDHCRPPRLFMELFAVICIETSHYVAFVKCGVGHEAPWCFFDSMADRKGEKNGYNIPEMVACPDISRWLSDEQICRQLNDEFPNDRHLPEHARRLLCDAYICMYQSSDVMMYR